MKIFTIASLLGLVLIPASLVSAQSVSESFSYTTGQPLSGQNGGAGFSSGWVASSPTIAAGSLSFGSLPTSGNSLAITATVDAGNLGSGTYRLLNTPMGGIGQDVWVSFLLEKTGGGYGGLVVGSGGATTGSSSGSKGIFIGYSGSAYNIGPNGAAGAIFGGTVTNGNVQFLVADFSYTTATSGTVSLYLSATPGGSLGTAVGSTTFTLNSFNQIGIAANGGAFFDEIRIGDSYASVSSIPEPATTVALFGLGALGIVFARRFRARPSAA